jgi:hypothetical protein
VREIFSKCCDVKDVLERGSIYIRVLGKFE